MRQSEEQKDKMKNKKSNVKHTSDGEMPDPNKVSSSEQVKNDVWAAYDAGPKSHRTEERIPESQGDLADRAEEEIENEIKGRIDKIREESKFPSSKDRH